MCRLVPGKIWRGDGEASGESAMRLKPSVRIELLHPLLKAALVEIEAVYNEHDSLLTITSGHEGDPSDKVHLATSKHYLVNNCGAGCAVDCRARHLAPQTIFAIVDGIRRRLGPAFDVVPE